MTQPTSILANQQAQHDVNAERVFEIIRSFGERGCISDDIQDRLGINERKIPYSSVTGPYAVLERKFYIERRGEQRMGHRFKRMQMVMHALSDEERQRRVAAHATTQKTTLTSDDLLSLQHWAYCNDQLQPIAAQELQFRQLLINKVFPNAPTGRTSIELADGYVLVLHRKRKVATLTMKQRKRRVRTPNV